MKGQLSRDLSAINLFCISHEELSFSSSNMKLCKICKELANKISSFINTQTISHAIYSIKNKIQIPSQPISKSKSSKAI